LKPGGLSYQCTWTSKFLRLLRSGELEQQCTKNLQTADFKDLLGRVAAQTTNNLSLISDSERKGTLIRCDRQKNKDRNIERIVNGILWEMQCARCSQVGTNKEVETSVTKANG